MKGVWRVGTTAQLRSVLHEACAAALTGGPGPVMVELDLRALSDPSASQDSPIECSSGRDDVDDASVVESISRLRGLFAAARRPMLLVGQGAFDIAPQLARLTAERLIPVVTTTSGRGVIPESHDLSMGGDASRDSVLHLNQLFERADLVVGLGCRLGHNGTAAFTYRLASERFVHVDADPDALGANYPASLQICAPVELAVGALTAREEATSWDLHELRVLREKIRFTPKSGPEPVIRGRRRMSPKTFFQWLRGRLPVDAILVTDSGLHQMLARRYFDVLAPRGLITPSDFQSMGFGLPAAIGATLGAPGRRIVALIGDGGFLMSGLEALTARREEVPVTIIVFNDGKLNLIRLQQWADSVRPHAVDVLNPEYESLARAFGIRYARYGDSTDEEIERALDGTSVSIIEVVVSDSGAMRLASGVAATKAVARGTMGSQLDKWLRQLRQQE